ncbi:MAG TPA: MFS transporter [Streptosporangiaceae bacterium]|nr:MFS transporter [Streptosporangiaceae bacterium]
MAGEAPGQPPVPRDAARRPGMLGALRQRDFGLLWSGQALSALGNQMFPILLAILVLERKAGPAGLGLVLAVQAAGLAIGMGLAATIGDRWRRTRVMIGTDVVRAAGVAALAISPARIPTALLIVFVIVVGVSEGMFLPTYGAVLPRLLSDAYLQPGNALTALSEYVAMVAGPAVAGVLIGLIGPGPSLWIDVATFAASIGSLLLISESAREQSEQPQESGTAGFGTGAVRRATHDLREGLRAVLDRPWVGAWIASATIVTTLAVAPAFVAAPIVARQSLGGAKAYGVMFTALGIGSVLGSVIGGRIRARRNGLVAFAGVLTIAGSVSSLAYLPLPGIVTFWIIAGIGVTVSQILWSTAVQQEVPDRLLGRVMALDYIGSQGLTPLGYAAAGFVIQAIGIRDMLIAGAVIVVIVTPLPLFVRGGMTLSTGQAAAAQLAEAGS